MEQALKKLGERVRELRKAKGYSQVSLAEKCNFTFSYIGGIERAEKNVSIRNLEKIAVALDVELYELFIDNMDVKNIAKKHMLLTEIVELLIPLEEKELKKASKILSEIFRV